MAMHPGLLPTLIPNHDYISLLHSLYQHRNSELFFFLRLAGSATCAAQAASSGGAARSLMRTKVSSATLS